ncbi:MAG: DUF3656 domain-containing protein [Dehalobacterium sp.]
MQIPEILAPAGDFHAFIAAVENGADTVYLGGKSFSARAFAGNFDYEELEKAVEYAHLRGVRIYVTVNILIDNSELKDAIFYVKNLYDLGVDGVILQDLGLSFLISQALPEMNMLGSTQMTIHNSEGAKFLAEMGFKRVVLARESSLEDISRINEESSIELEIFAHGALCISYSGQCLMSSLIGGRSGNRGKCAQPCRMTYTLVDEKGNNAADEGIGEHLLSPRDLNTLELLPEICQSGVSSLKFEGRMKRLEYVATVIRIYRAALDRLRENPDSFMVDPEELKELAQIFNRDFTLGYLLKNPGRNLMSFKRPNNRGARLGRIEEIQDRGRMALIKLDERLRVGDGVEIWVTKGGRQGFFIESILRNGKSIQEAEQGDTVSINILGRPKVGDRVFKTHDVKLIEGAQNTYLNPQEFIGVNFHFFAREGQPFVLRAEDEAGNKSEFCSEYIVEKANKRPADEDYVRNQLNRLGGTSFRLKSLTFDMTEGLMLPASELNTARRMTIDIIKKKRLEKYSYPPVEMREVEKRYHSLLPERRKRQISNLKLSVRVGSYEGARAALDAGADIIYLGGEIFRSEQGITFEQVNEIARKGQEKGREIVYTLPRIFKTDESKVIYQMITEAEKSSVKALMVGNLGGITAAKMAHWGRKVYTDVGLNVFNDITINFLTKRDIKLMTLSLELTFAQMEKMNFGSAEIECIGHGALPMMVSQYCAVGSILGGKCEEKACNRPCRERSYGLKDRMSYIFPLEMDQFCRMHIYNPKELCLIAHVNKFINLGINSLRIEAMRYNPQTVYQVARSYRQVIDAASAHMIDKLNLEEMENSLEKLSRAGFTKGHYFRGVI